MSHGWDEDSGRNYEADAQHRATIGRIADYHQRREEIDRRYRNEDHFIAVHNLAHEFSDLVDDQGGCPIDEITEYLAHNLSESAH